MANFFFTFNDGREKHVDRNTVLSRIIADAINPLLIYQHVYVQAGRELREVSSVETMEALLKDVKTVILYIGSELVDRDTRAPALDANGNKKIERYTVGTLSRR